MSNELLEHVQRDLIPVLGMPVTIVDEMASSSFGDALVILRMENLRIQIVRDRMKIRIEIGTMDHPHVSFDDQILGEFLGVGPDNIFFPSSDLAGSMHLVATFLEQFRNELTAMFSPEQFSRTRKAIGELQEARARRLFGPLMRGS
jgi:hypothetical protein